MSKAKFKKGQKSQSGGEDQRNFRTGDGYGTSSTGDKQINHRTMRSQGKTELARFKKSKFISPDDDGQEIENIGDPAL